MLYEADLGVIVIASCIAKLQSVLCQLCLNLI